MWRGSTGFFRFFIRGTLEGSTPSPPSKFINHLQYERTDSYPIKTESTQVEQEQLRRLQLPFLRGHPRSGKTYLPRDGVLRHYLG